MSKLKFALKGFLTSVIATTLIAVYPISAFAAASVPSACGVPITGVTTPSGAAASTFTYDSDTCLWANTYYTWSPVTKTYTPNFDQPYTYNAATGLYDAPNWVYSAAAGAYQQTTISVAMPPAGAEVIGGPSSISNTGTGSDNTINNDGGGTGTISNTGDNSTNGINNGNNSNGTIDSTTGITVNNLIGSSALSGDATVSQNTTAGNAASGDAQAQANVINLLQSNAAGLQGNVATFNANIYGNVQGDITLDPSQLNAASSNTDPSGNLVVNSSDTNSINNNVNLDATSGNATSSENTTVGNTSTGDANAVANIVNVINSIIGSGQSFVGTINIYGNYDGDILLPQDTLNQLLASNFPTVNASVSPSGTVSLINNTGQDSNNAINNTGGSSTNVNADSNTAINNNLNLNAASGDATSSENTTAGSTKTGSANTNLTLLNLTGQQIIGGDALLVFVNVLGNWVGMIVNAPAGATSAALGGGITTDSNLPSNTTVNATGSNTINNNLNLNAQSGNASADKNTTAGNVSSGNATSSANIANISNSALSFSNWFGVLFINVYGTWTGSFGVNTAAGGTGSPVGGKGGGAVQGVQTFALTGGTGGTFHASSVNNSSAFSAVGDTSNNNASQHTFVLGSTSNKTPKAPQQAKASGGTFAIVALVMGLIGFGSLVFTTQEIRKALKNASAPVMHGVQAVGTRLLTFLF